MLWQTFIPQNSHHALCILLLLNGYMANAKKFFEVTENISYQVAPSKISKELLHRIIESIMNGTYDYNEELKLDIYNAIRRMIHIGMAKIKITRKRKQLVRIWGKARENFLSFLSQRICMDNQIESPRLIKISRFDWGASGPRVCEKIPK